VHRTGRSTTEVPCTGELGLLWALAREPGLLGLKEMKCIRVEMCGKWFPSTRDALADRLKYPYLRRLDYTGRLEHLGVSSPA